MISKIKINDNELTAELRNMLQAKCGIVDGIEMTCQACPEQYNLYDISGNQVAYLRYRNDIFTITCPTCDSPVAKRIYECKYVQGDDACGYFSPENRIKYLSKAIDEVASYYINRRLIQANYLSQTNRLKDQVIYTTVYTNNEVYKKLHEYERSNFTPEEVRGIRQKGPVLGYEDACLMVLKDHRVLRGDKFPEANGKDGMTTQHALEEIEWFRIGMQNANPDNPFGYLCLKANIINEMFDKDFNDFKEVFITHSKMGNTRLHPMSNLPLPKKNEQPQPRYTKESLIQAFDSRYEYAINNPDSHYSDPPKPLFNDDGTFNSSNWCSNQADLRTRVADFIYPGRSFEKITDNGSLIYTRVLNEEGQWYLIINLINEDMSIYDTYVCTWYKSRGCTEMISFNGKPITIDQYVELLNKLETNEFFNERLWS